MICCDAICPIECSAHDAIETLDRIRCHRRRFNLLCCLRSTLKEGVFTVQGLRLPQGRMRWSTNPLRWRIAQGCCSGSTRLILHANITYTFMIPVHPYFFCPCPPPPPSPPPGPLPRSIRNSCVPPPFPPLFLGWVG